MSTVGTVWVDTYRSEYGDRMWLAHVRRAGVTDVYALWLTRRDDETGYVHMDKLTEGDWWECLYHTGDAVAWNQAQAIAAQIKDAHHPTDPFTLKLREAPAPIHLG